MSVFFEFLKSLLCCVEEYHERDRTQWERNNDFEELPSCKTFVRSSAPSFNYPVRRTDPETVISVRDVNRTNPFHVSSTRTAPSFNSSQRPTSPYVPPRVPTTPSVPPKVPTTPHIPPRVPVIPTVPVIPPRVVINRGFIDEAESLSLSSFASYPPPSSSSSPSSAKPPPLSLSSKQSSSSPKPASSVSKASPSSSGLSSSSLKSALPSFKPTLARAPYTSTNQQGRTNYIWVEKGASPIYVIPKDIEDLIKKGIVPGVLKRPLSPLTYKDYFGALLYAEDFYIEKWSNYMLNNVTVKLQKASIYKSDRNIFQYESDDKTFVAFEMDSVRERRPFLLSRDFVFLRPSGSNIDPFKGVIYRVEKSKTVLVEFEEDFYSEHYPSCKYNVSFSFNRFCLKRAHQAIEAASNPSFQNFLFPDFIDRNLSSPTSLSFTRSLDLRQVDALLRILGLNSAPPYLVEGPLSVLNVKQGELSKTGRVVQEAIVHIFHTSPNSRILVCAPTNNTCDALMRNLKKEIRESDMFRANAAFRELDGVPVDVLPSCRYRDECFTCPSLRELRKFKVVLSTFVSSFRLHGEGISAGHFSHIFLVDASSITEPEMMVALANLANDDTAVVITGAPKRRSSWVRSDIARQNGLRISYFERLRESKPYKSLNPKFISQLEST